MMFDASDNENTRSLFCARECAYSRRDKQTRRLHGESVDRKPRAHSSCSVVLKEYDTTTFFSSNRTTRSVVLGSPINRYR